MVKRAASRQIVKGQNTARPKKKLKIRHESAGSAIRQSARAHAIGIAAEVEKRLVEEAARKVAVAAILCFKCADIFSPRLQSPKRLITQS